MKKFLKSVPFALLVLPLVAGCGKNGPSLSKKGQIVSEEVFGESLDAALEASIWANPDYKIAGGVLKGKVKTTTSSSVKREKKVISSSKTVITEKEKYEFDGAKYIANFESTSKSKIVKKGVGIKKDKHVAKEVEKEGCEAQALYAGKANALISFDHVKKEYTLANAFEDASALDEGFQMMIKSTLAGVFDLDVPDPEKGTVSLYQNGKIFSYEYKYTDLIGSSDNGGYYNEEITYVSKGQLNLNPGKYEVISFSSSSSKKEYVKNYSSAYSSTVIYAVGDVVEQSTIQETHVKGKEKKTNLKYTKTAKYKDTYSSSFGDIEY